MTNNKAMSETEITDWVTIYETTLIKIGDIKQTLNYLHRTNEIFSIVKIIESSQGRVLIIYATTNPKEKLKKI